METIVEREGNMTTAMINLKQNQFGNGEIPSLQLTAVVYLQEALAKERYEECSSIIAGARELGVPEAVIQRVCKQRQKTVT